MALTYGFYDSLNGDRKYNASQMSKIFEGIITDGVFQSLGSALAVYQQEVPAMSVQVGTGRAWFNLTWTNVDALYSVVVSPSNSVLNRRDTVVIEVNTSLVVRANSIKIIAGTPATTPVAPTLLNTSTIKQYALADVYVAANVTQIIQSNITNRVGSAGTPYITAPLTSLNVQTLFDQLTAQYVANNDANQASFDAWFTNLGITLENDQATFDAWFNNLVDNLTTNQAINLQAQVDALAVLVGTPNGDLQGQIDALALLVAADTGNLFYTDQSAGAGDSYGQLVGAVDGTNTIFTTSAGKYISGSLVVYLNGQLLTQGTLEDWVQTSISTGVFTFLAPPVTGDQISVTYMVGATGSNEADTLDGYHAASFMLNTAKATASEVTGGTEDTKFVTALSIKNSVNIPTISPIGSSGHVITSNGATWTSAAPAAPTVTPTSVNTLTNKRIKKRVVAVTQAAAPAINTDDGDIFEIIGLAQAITDMSTNLNGVPSEGEMIEIIFKDNGTARAITWGIAFVASGNVALPTTTVISTQLAVLFQCRVGAVWGVTRWTCVGVA